MIPPLPVEILSHILDLATSPYDAVSAYKEDQRLLSSVCLVSKQMCAVAQPMLWSVFVSRGGDLSVLSTFLDLAQNVRVLELKSLGKAKDDVVKAVKKLPNLIEVRIAYGVGMSRTQLSSIRSASLFFESLLWSC
jgi:hypothetical protein